MFNLAQRLNKPEIAIDEAIYQYAYDHRGCMPGVIVDVSDSPNIYGVTVTVRPAIIEKITSPTDGTIQSLTLPDLPMVPLAVMGGGGFFVTFPVAVGDECLVIFQDMCIDAMWQAGSTGDNTFKPQAQLDKRRHDLADAICFPLRWTQPGLNGLTNYSNSSMQLRSIDGTTVIDIKESQITITNDTQVQIVSPLITMGMAGGNVPLPLVNDNFFQWFVTNIYPFLTGLGYAGPIVPVNSETTITLAS
jgi:hypothetical protein